MKSPAMNKVRLDPVSTPRLIIREAQLSDADFMLRLLNEPAWKEFIGDFGVNDQRAAVAYVEQQFLAAYPEGLGFWVVELQEEGTPIGVCGVKKRPFLENVDFGFGFLTDYCGQGYAAEAARRVLTHVREVIGLDYLLAIVQPDNAASITLLQRLGFQYTESMVHPEGGEQLSVFALSGAPPP